MESPSDNLYMTNLPADVTDAQITEVFSLYGTVLSAKVLSGGAALVRFESMEEAESIVTQMSGAVPLGFQEPVTIKFALPGANLGGKASGGKGEKPASGGKGEKPAAQAPGYGKWKMAEKKLSTPWSIPNAPAGGAAAGGAAAGGPGGLLRNLGATSTASKGKGKGGLPTPAPLDEFDAIASQHATEYVVPASSGQRWAAPPPLVAPAAPAAAFTDVDEFDKLFEAYSSGHSDEQFAASAGGAEAAHAAADSWSMPSAASSAGGWSIPSAASAAHAGGWAALAGAADGGWSAATGACAASASGWAVSSDAASDGSWAAAAAAPADGTAWNGAAGPGAAADPWQEEEAAWLAGAQDAASAAAAAAGVPGVAGGEVAAWGGPGLTWTSPSPTSPSLVPIGGGDWGVEPSPCDNLYIKGLPTGIDEAWLTEALSGIGTVTSVRILKASGPDALTTCAALARFDTVQTAQTVKDILHGQSPEWCPGEIVARFATKKPGKGEGDYGDYVAVESSWPVPVQQVPSSSKGGFSGGKGGGGFFPKGGGADGKGKGGGDGKADRLCAMIEGTQVLPGDQHRSPEGSVYVAGLPGDTLEKHVYQLFAPFGAIISIFTKVGAGGKNGEWAIAFVNYVEPLSAQAAIAVYNGFQLPDGNVMKVNIKQSKGVSKGVSPPPVQNGLPQLTFTPPATVEAQVQGQMQEAQVQELQYEAMVQAQALLEATTPMA